MLALIWAQGGIPWHLPEDFQHYKTLTSGHPIIMGERMWVSLPQKAATQSHQHRAN